MQIYENYDLTPFNTFGVGARAKYFVEITNKLELLELFSSLEFRDNDKLFLGGGSNVLFIKDFEGIVILNKLKGIDILKEDAESVFVKSMSGEIWHNLVSFAVEHNYWGIENLAFVPGTVGAAPMQNIGAYGVEIKDTLESVEAIEIETGESKVFKNKECEFGYRDSIFKNSLKNKYFIIAVVFKLSKIPKPNISYKILKEYLDKNQITPDSSKIISEAVVAIRKTKLPDPKLIGNAGSFFKNVFLERDSFQKLRASYPDVPSFEEDGFIKIPAGWLIENCGWKGYRIGNVGVHDMQALVLVNHGGATGLEIKNLAKVITDSVYEKFGVTLVPEVNFI
jgi:UDP-N-acetylmuramate dehydrogenase